MPLGAFPSPTYLLARHLGWASLQYTESLSGLGPTWIDGDSGGSRSIVACQCEKTAVHLRSQTQNPHATEIHQLPDLPFLSLYSAHLPLHPVCRAGCSRKEEVLLIFSMCFTFLIGETGCLLLFLCFKWCDSCLGLVLNKQQNIRQIEASETFWFVGKLWAHPQPQVTGWVGEASRF